jgi:hypothetical protein
VKEAAVGRETPKRAAFFLAAMSVALCVLGSMRAAAVFRFARPQVLAWMPVPLALAIAGTLASLSRWMGPIWLCTGALFGFVILGAWSLGLFYGYGAMVMLLAALAHLAAVRPGWRTLLVPVWVAAGAGGVSAVFFLRDVSRSNAYMQVTHADAVLWGTWLFVAALVLLLLTYGAIGLRRRTA